jgi:outer membrane protein TolC
MRWMLLLVAITGWLPIRAYGQFDQALMLLGRPDSSMLFGIYAPSDTLAITPYLLLVQSYHPEIRAAAAALDRARGAERSAWGALDPRLSATLGTKNYENGFKNNEFQASLSLPLYWGQRIMLGYRRATAFFDQDYLTGQDGEPSISLSLPLIRNVLTDPIRTSIGRTEQAVVAAQAALQERRNFLSFTALSEYYTWAAARARLDIAAQLFQVAYVRYQWIQAEIARGERAPIDSVEILQEVFRRRSLLVRARNAFERAALTIWMTLWNDTFSAPSSIARYTPEPLPAPLFLDSLRVEFDRIRARQRRPELQRLNAEFEQTQLDIRLARESFKPTLNAKVSMYSPAPSPTFGQMPAFWKAGLDFELPLLYRAPIGQEQQAIAARTQLEALVQLQQRRVDNEVLIAAMTVNATYQQAILAQAERIAAERMANAEQQLFERGESDLLRLNLRERLLAEAQEREIEALQAHATAWALYRWAIADY